ncbi:hypothetical protein RKD26_000428 [Streptomyces calvus]
MHHIAGPHDDQRLGQQVVHRHLRAGRERTVRVQAHHRPAAQQFRRLELGRHVVTLQVVHQPQIETAFQQKGGPRHSA